MKTIITVALTIIITGLSASAFATSYKCVSTSLNPEVVRYEVEFSFEPVAFRLNSFVKEDDGSWSMDSETLADAAAVLKPVKTQWLACQTNLNSNSTDISYDWSKGSQAAGHLFLNLKYGTGEFFSSFQMSGTAQRRIQFSECAETISK